MSDPTNDDSYDRQRRRAARRQAEQAASGREIGQIPKCQSPKRREKCRSSSKLYMETYHKPAFPLKWSRDHLTVFKRLDAAVNNTKLFGLAMPRGSGKTTIFIRAVLWAVLYAHARFAALIEADETLATRSLAQIKIELETNELLLRDFPEVVYPIRKLERIANRVQGQTHNGQPTWMEWGKDRIVLPTIEGSAVSGAVLFSGGILSAVRGAVHTLPTGEVIRPDFALVNDPQTRASAMSTLQCQTREKIVSADILGMAGPDKEMAALGAFTVIRKGDMADRITNRKVHPHWHGERMKLLYQFPTRMDLWERYWEILRDELENDGDGRRATTYYKRNRKKMNAGARLAWPERKVKGCVSALQHAMNLFYRDTDAFWSEYQNEPLDEVVEASDLMTAEEIAAKQNGLPRHRVPLDTYTITAMIDVQNDLLFYMVVAWAQDFTGAVIDYGTFPDQKRPYFTLATADPTLRDVKPRAGLEGCWQHGLTELTRELLTKPWKREDGVKMGVELCLIDANYGRSTDTIYNFVRNSQADYGSRILPAHGRFVGASSTPFSDYKKKPGEQIGHHWRVPSPMGRRVVLYVLSDVNHWKSFIHERWKTAFGDAGSLTLWKAPADTHRMIAEHQVAEYPVETTAHGRTVDEWKAFPDRRDNHGLDLIVGCAVGASMRGCQLEPNRIETGSVLRLSDLQKQRRAAG